MITNYCEDEFGVIHQTDREEFHYDEKYVTAYNNFKQTTKEMSYLRLGYLLGAVGYHPVKRILDYGYGNGAFLEVARDTGDTAYGTDISNYPVPAGCEFIPPSEVLNHSFDVVCFFDCLEHIPDMSFVANLKTKFVYISLPWCHYITEGDEWFKNWKHRKPNEHLHHFNEFSLRKYMESLGYDTIITGNPEDVIRRGIYPGRQNILSGVFSK